MKNSSAGLFLGSSSMFMPNFVWIRLTGSKLLQKHWKSITRRKFLTAGGHLGFWKKWKNSFAGLFLGSSSMSMPNFVWIRWTESKLLQIEQKYNASWISLKTPISTAILNFEVVAVIVEHKWWTGSKLLQKHFFLFFLLLPPLFFLWQSSSKSSPVGAKNTKKLAVSLT